MFFKTFKKAELRRRHLNTVVMVGLNERVGLFGCPKLVIVNIKN
jgi:hypothetical protein